MNITIYQNQDFLLVRKPHGIPSTFGNMESFLDLIKEHLTEGTFTWTPLSGLVPEDIFPLLSSRLSDFEEAQTSEECEKILRQQVDTFGQDQEFGLLNRLDNDTAGFLYFARTHDSFSQFRSLQKENKISKFYLAQVQGTLDMKHEAWSIHFPIMHHKSNPEKMIVIQNPKDIKLGRSKEHQVDTNVQILHFDEQANISTILATITKGVRHQIRVHLASIGYPIIGDVLYSGKEEETLRLRSMGFKIMG